MKFRFVILVSGRACGRHALTRKLRKHAGTENQNKRGLCVSGYFPLGRSHILRDLIFLKKCLIVKTAGYTMYVVEYPQGVFKAE